MDRTAQVSLTRPWSVDKQMSGKATLPPVPATSQDGTTPPLKVFRVAQPFQRPRMAQPFQSFQDGTTPPLKDLGWHNPFKVLRMAQPSQSPRITQPPL